MELSHLINQLKLPKLTLVELNFCSSTVDGVTQWCGQLPMANTGAAAKQLFQMLPMINQWQAPPELRLQCLDIVKPYVYDICHLLQQHYSMANHLEPRQVKIANLNRALQLQLLIGYEQTAVQLITQGTSKQLIELALYRSFAELEQILLEALRLYTAPPSRMWRDGHTLVQLAESLSCEHSRVTDPSLQHTQARPVRRVIDPYLQALLLHACRPNNLRPEEISILQKALGLWVDKVNWQSDHIKDCLFIVNLEQDQGARYRQHIESLQAPTLRGIDTKRLVQLLKYAADHPEDDTGITIPVTINQHLLEHLTSSWGVQWQRAFDRIVDVGELELAVGIAASHYQACGRISFESFVNWQAHLQQNSVVEAVAASPVETITKSMQSRSSKADIWANAFDAKPSNHHTELTEKNNSIDFHQQDDKPMSEPGRYPNYSVSIVNASTGGYCVRWQGKIADNLQAGELLSVKAKDNTFWSVGILRWVRRDHHHNMLTGIEILANKTCAAFARKLAKTGNNGPRVKALILPEIISISQPASVIVPQLTFATGQRILLNFDGKCQRIALTEKVTETNSMSQFNYRVIGDNYQAPTSKPYETLSLDDAPIPSPDSFDNL